MTLRPFWSYYGSKYRAAVNYPAPTHATIVEPFAGSAGYSLRYPDRNVVLVEKYDVLAELWRYLIAVSAEEIMRIPIVESVDDLPSWVPAGGRYLVGFGMNKATTTPRRRLSAGVKRLRTLGRASDGWAEHRRNLVASQVDKIRHWKVIEGDYTDAPDIEATWFVDPPYSNAAGAYYRHSNVDYNTLGAWCRDRAGQVIVCENSSATWLPFEHLASPKTMYRDRTGTQSHEAMWYRP